MDQFLEGIISIMKSLKINPYGNLVRVGGQSKIEEIQQYNIRNIRDSYLNKKRFDSNYAQLRSRTRNQLLLRHDYRADLKSLFSDLSKPEGIVNFHRLNEQIMQESPLTNLHMIFPAELALLFLSKGNSLFNWLQLNYQIFDSDRISIQNILRSWFRFTSVTVMRSKGQDQELNKEVEENEEEFEDEELRRILLSHRIEEEIMEEDRTYKAARLAYHINYEQVEMFRAQQNDLWSEFQNAKECRDYRTARRLEGEIYELGLQKNKFMNQCKFMKEFFRSHQEGRIDLPKVTPDLLAKTLDKNSLWRLSISEKWAIYFHFIDEIKQYLIKEIMNVEAVLIEDQKKSAEVKNQGDGFILQQAQVVGMTTTGAAKYNTVLRMMKSKIGLLFYFIENMLNTHHPLMVFSNCRRSRRSS